MNEIQERSREKRLRVVAKRGDEGGVDLREEPVDVGRTEHVERHVEQAVTLFHRAPVFGDVDRHGDDPGLPAAPVALNTPAEQDRQP